jgi:hypothetical protein
MNNYFFQNYYYLLQDKWVISIFISTLIYLIVKSILQFCVQKAELKQSKDKFEAYLSYRCKCECSKEKDTVVSIHNTNNVSVSANRRIKNKH